MGFLNLGQLSIGFGIGFSSVLIPQLQDPQDQTFSKVKIEVGVTEISWIVSLISLGQIAGSVIGAFLASAIGRKGLLNFLLPVNKKVSLLRCSVVVSCAKHYRMVCYCYLTKCGNALCWQSVVWLRHGH